VRPMRACCRRPHRLIRLSSVSGQTALPLVRWMVEYSGHFRVATIHVQYNIIILTKLDYNSLAGSGTSWVECWHRRSHWWQDLNWLLQAGVAHAAVIR
jgi:hypothetical protein